MVNAFRWSVLQVTGHHQASWRTISPILQVLLAMSVALLPIAPAAPVICPGQSVHRAGQSDRGRELPARQPGQRVGRQRSGR